MNLTPERVEKLSGQAQALAIGFFVVGGLFALGALSCLGLVALGGALFAGGVAENEPALMIVGGVYGGLGLVMTIFMGALGLFDVVAGVNLLKKRGRTLIIVASIANLFIQPLGLVLGVLGLIFIFQKDVDELFSSDDALLESGRLPA